MDIVTVAVMALASWRIASMFVQEAGPFDIFERLRSVTRLGGLLECVWCMSVWTAALVWLIWPTEAGAPIVFILALSAGAVLVDKAAK